MNEKLQAYMDGELSAEESRAFESALETDSELRAAYDHALVAKRLSAGLVELDMRERLRAEYRPVRRIWMLGAVAAVLVAVLGLFLFRSMLSNEQAKYAMEYSEPLWPGTRGGDDELVQILRQFRQVGNVQTSKRKILALQDIEDEMKAYWISELFLYQSAIDSAAYYLPSLSEDHIKYDRSLWILSYIEQNQSTR